MPESTMKLATALGPLTAGAAESSAETVPPATREQVDKLIAVLESDASQKDKVDACRQLGVIGTGDAVPVLAALLGDEKLSHMARYGLEPNPDPAVDEALRQALGTVKGPALVGVIHSIGVRRDAVAVRPLVRRLDDPDADVARAAARALGRIATPGVAKVLTETLGRAAAELRPAVADACLACAEALLAAGQRDEAAAMYQSVGAADLPKHFRVAAAHGAILARQPGAQNDS